RVRIITREWSKKLRAFRAWLKAVPCPVLRERVRGIASRCTSSQPRLCLKTGLGKTTQWQLVRKSQKANGCSSPTPIQYTSPALSPELLPKQSSTKRHCFRILLNKRYVPSGRKPLCR